MEHVLRAAADELIAHGYIALSIERVAEKAGVNKTTIYRRWPTKKLLVQALVESIGGDPPPTPNTGEVEKDLLTLARATRNRSLEFHKQGLARLFALQIEQSDIRDIGAAIREQLREPWRQALRAAIERGELDAATDIALVLEAIVSTIVQRVVKAEYPADEAFLGAVVKLILDGVRAR